MQDFLNQQHGSQNNVEITVKHNMGKIKKDFSVQYSSMFYLKDGFHETLNDVFSLVPTDPRRGQSFPPQRNEE